MNKITPLALLLVLSSISFGQEPALNQFFTNYRIVSIDSELLFEKAKSAKTDVISIDIDEWSLQLFPSDVLAPGYKSLDDKGNNIGDEQSRPIALNGYSSKGGRTAITLANNFIYGFIQDGKELYYIEPLKYYDKNVEEDRFLIYSVSDVKESAPKTCAYKETRRRTDNIPTPKSEKLTGLCYEIEYGICNDYLMFTDFGSVGAVEAHTIGVTNNVNTNYDDEFDDELRYVISGQYTITTNGGDPWSNSTDPEVLLPSFRDWAVVNLDAAPLNIAHDVASLWSGRNFDGTTVGLAYTPGTCQSNSKYNILENYTGNANSLRVLTAHELGHNLGYGHDEGTTIYIMSPSVSNTVLWSAASVTAIENYYNANSCLSICAGSIPQVNFAEFSSSVGEAGTSGTGGTCNQPYVDITKAITISIAPAANIVLNIADAGSGTGTVNYDYEVITSSLTFTPTGSLSQDVTIRIYDDVVEEVDETVNIAVSIASGSATIGPINQHELTITSNDEVSSTCCSGGGEVDYGSSFLAINSIFLGNNSDARTRIIVRAADLTALGMGSGIFDQLSVYVSSKNSGSNPFQNFRIGFLEVTESQITGSTTWYNTTEVFLGDVITTANSYNNFTFTNPFNWDGTSNLYIEFCFDNSAAIGNDLIRVHARSGIGNQSPMFQQSSSGTPGCSLIPGGYSWVGNYHPNMRFRQLTGAMVETTVGSTSGGRINVGDTGHFYSANDRVIASVKNIGSTAMECVDVTIHTAGNGMTSLPFGSNSYTQKTFQVTADNSSAYELTLYFTDAELAIWGADTSSLNFIQSPTPIASATASGSSFINTSEFQFGVAGGANKSYKGTVNGNAYFALTETQESIDVFANVLGGDLVLDQMNSGLLLKNSAGTEYLLSVDALGSLNFNLSGGATASATIENTNFYLSDAGSGLILSRGAGSYTKIAVDNDGVISTSNISSLPAPNVIHETGNFSVNTNGAGIILKNAENECWQVFANASGVLQSKLVACP